MSRRPSLVIDLRQRWVFFLGLPLLVAGLLMGWRHTRAIAQPAPDLVALYYPTDLDAEAIELARAGGPAPVRHSAFVLADLTGEGATNDIIAVYSNRISGRVRVLRRSTLSVQVVDGPSNAELTGTLPGIALMDLDGVAPPEMMVSLTTMSGGHHDWLYRWNGSALELIGPTSADPAGTVTSLLSNATFRDLDGDGILEAISGVSALENDESLPARQPIYRLVGGQFTLWKQPWFYGEFARKMGEDVTTASVEVNVAAGNYQMRVVNGNADGTRRVRSGSLRLNGQTICDACSFGRDVAGLVMPVQMNESNLLEVELRGSAGREISVLIEDLGS